MLLLVARRLLPVAAFALLLIAGSIAVGFAAYRYRDAFRAFFHTAPIVTSDVSVTIPEGSTAWQIDSLLAEQGIVASGTFATFVASSSSEGYLFPDTYRFERGTAPAEVERTLRETFERKAGPLFTGKAVDIREAVIIASMLEKEVVTPEDRRVVAGIIKKRLAASKKLQIDATVCYLKMLAIAPDTTSCYPITLLDLTIDSPYNTYLYKGLPPGPIGNPGIDALTATLDAQPSPFWFYLSDPATGRTIFSVTGEEHEANRLRYLGDS